MEFFEAIILATLTVVLLFQIVIMMHQRKNGKLIREMMAQRPKPFQSDRDHRDRKDPGFRQHRQNQQDFRSKQQHAPSGSAQAGGVDNVEKSLRDINLKLKNAERDQEAARRRIQENMGKDHPHRRHHNDTNRGGGGRDDGRDRRRDRRDRHNRGNWQNRGNQGKPYHDSGQPSQQADRELQEATATAEQEQVPIILPDLNPTDFDGDNTEHGRKFMVRRRLLKEDTPGENTGQAEATTAPQNGGVEPVEFTESDRQPEQTGDAEISFGRR